MSVVTRKGGVWFPTASAWCALDTLVMLENLNVNMISTRSWSKQFYNGDVRCAVTGYRQVLTQSRTDYHSSYDGFAFRDIEMICEQATSRLLNNKNKEGVSKG